MLNLRGLRRPSSQHYQQNVPTGQSTWLPRTDRGELSSIIGDIGGTLGHGDRGPEDEYDEVADIHHETIAADSEKEGLCVPVSAYSSEVSHGCNSVLSD